MTQSTAARDNAWSGRIEDDALLRGQGRFGDDVKPEGALARLFRALAARLREDRAYRYVRCEEGERRGRGVHRGRSCSAHYHSISHRFRFLVAKARSASAASAGAGRGPRDAYGRAGRDGGCRNAAAAQDAAEISRRRLRAADAGDQHARRDRARRAAAVAGCSREISGLTGLRRPIRTARNRRALDRAFKDAAHVVRVELINQRLVVASLEPRTASASYDAASNQFTLRVRRRRASAACACILPGPWASSRTSSRAHRRCRRRFGMKAATYPEYIALLHMRPRARQADPLGLRPARKLSSPTTRAAIHCGPSNLRSANAAAFWHCG